MLPSEFATAHTLEFLLAHLSGRTRVLEVGCGTGEVAAGLQAAGHEVVAIDSSGQAIQAARLLGIDARRATWPDFDEPSPIGTIIFTRSLHHVAELHDGVRRITELLSPGSTVVVEDFAFDAVDEVTAEWFVGVMRILDLSDALSREPAAFATRLVEGRDGLAIWREDHGHHIHTWSDIRQAVSSRLEVISETDAVYLYRYACEVLPRTERGGAIAARLYALECALARHGAGCLIGRRLVARVPSVP